MKELKLAVLSFAQDHFLTAKFRLKLKKVGKPLGHSGMT